MKIRLAACCLLPGLILPCRAADLGVGVSFQGSGQSVRLPVIFSPGFRLEATLAFDHATNDAAGTTRQPAPGGMVQGGISTASTDMSLAVGAYWTRPVGEAGKAYLGPRLGWTHSTERNSQEVLFADAGGVVTRQTYTSEMSGHAWSLAPVLGFEYYPVKQLSLGVEVAAPYSSQSTEMSSNGNSSHGNRFSTETSVTLRWYF